MATLTSVILQAQMDDLGGYPITDVPQQANYAMRARQLTLMHSIHDMQLFKDQYAQFTFQGTSTGTLAQTIWPTKTGNSRHSLPIAKVQPLLPAGIADNQQILEPGTK